MIYNNLLGFVFKKKYARIWKSLFFYISLPYILITPPKQVANGLCGEIYYGTGGLSRGLYYPPVPSNETSGLDFNNINTKHQENGNCKNHKGENATGSP